MSQSEEEFLNSTIRTLLGNQSSAARKGSGRTDYRFWVTMGMETWSEASHAFPPCQSRAGSPGAQEFWAGRAHACGRAADLGL